MYDSLYAGSRSAGFGVDFAGWVSSFDGAPIPLPQMCEWRDQTVRRIVSLRPRRVLEIGVGSGLLLAQVAPVCELYWGTDLSPEVIDRLAGQVAGRVELAGRVVLRAQPADVFDGWGEGMFDTVVINSVVQYFPGVDYLVEVLRGALRVLAPGGAVFVGDVRHRGLAECLYRSVHESRGVVDGQVLAGRVAESARSDQELLVDPGFFSALRGVVDGLDVVDVRVKRGVSDNELTRYRYDVALHKAPTSGWRMGQIRTVSWGDGVSDRDAVVELLDRDRPEPVVLAGVPNPRISGAVSEALDPEGWYEFGHRQGYQTTVTWSRQTGDGSLDVLFTPAGGRDEVVVDTGVAVEAGTGLSVFVNDPGRARQVEMLSTQL
ncbi:class I SAM-dependent methyltransferase, partial [Rugosimonospora africana]|uniref:class I SAM-dependent methyltransferase n=1 Tax=Rugosimonospora africana TaxID=556532 RepID=UPI001945512A